jgi:hypothetical protein
MASMSEIPKKLMHNFWILAALAGPGSGTPCTPEAVQVGADAGHFENGYLIEKIGEPFTDKNGREMVRVTLVKRTIQ